MSHTCPAKLEVESHSMLIIASDSYDVQPVSVDSLITEPGERYDFIINANQPDGERKICLIFSSDYLQNIFPFGSLFNKS